MNLSECPLHVTLQDDRRAIEDLIVQIEALSFVDDAGALGRRRALLAELRLRVLAHCRAEDQTFSQAVRTSRARSAQSRLVREEHDFGVRFEQLEAIPLDDFLWDAHFHELARRLRVHLAHERLPSEAHRLLGAEELIDLAARYRRVREETVGLLASAASWRAVLARPASEPVLE